MPPRSTTVVSGAAVGGLDEDRCYRAVLTRDVRFDGWFVTAVVTTRIYCRPSCPAMTPKRQNMRYYPSAAAAQQHGFRACKRCRPDASPGSPQWNTREDVVARAMRLIADGLVDREGVSGLAARLGYSERHLTRMVGEELGAGPLAIARAQRAHTARLLIESTELPFTDIAHGAGFGSVRQFNDTVREVFAVAPSELRRLRRAAPTAAALAAPGEVSLRLPARAPFDGAAIMRFLAMRCVPGVEAIVDGAYHRTLRLPNGPGTVALRAEPDGVRAVVRVADWRDVAPAVQRCRRLLDLDADPVAIDEALGSDPVLGSLVAASPGRRSPGHVDGAELAVRAVLGQQVSVAGARTVTARIVAVAGERLTLDDPHLTHLFPAPSALAALPAEHLPMPGSRRRTLRAMCAAIDRGDIEIDAGADRAQLVDRLLAVPGIGPWTASYVVMRGLNYPDSFLPSDVGVRNALARMNVDSSPRGAAALAERWRPFRSYALHHLWASLDHEPPTRERMEEEDQMTSDGRVAARFGGGRLLTEAEHLTYALLPSPVGVLTLAASATGLRYVLWENDELTRVPGGADTVDAATHPILAIAARQLTEYFAGERTEFDVPLEPQGSEFQLAAWQALRTIPYGQTVSYGEQARRLGDVNKSRAVGAANGRNPLSIIVPCHRVVGSDGSLTGFGGGIEAKAWLLAHESNSPTLW